MRIEFVNAHAFGKFSDERLELAPGMNVVHGPNEAGKSTWHAALYLGLCGMRQGKGARRKDDQELEERHRPWDGDGAWDVGVTIRLDDGRKVELRHNLAAKTATVEDVDIAERSYEGEVLFDGSPDGSRWLGLNRESFLQTACVRQAQLLAVLDNADALQTELQAAVAKAEADATAARALDALENYRRERIGSTRAPTKPLETSRKAAEEAKAHLEDARADNERHQEQTRHVEALAEEAARCSRQILAAKAEGARKAALEVAERLRKAGALAAEFPDGAPPSVQTDTALLGDVAQALASWDNTPPPRKPAGEPVDALAQRQSALQAELDAVDSAKPTMRPGPLGVTVAAALFAIGGAVLLHPAMAAHAALGAIPAALGMVSLWWAVLHSRQESRRYLADQQADLTEQLRFLESDLEQRRVEEAERERVHHRRKAAGEGLQALAAKVGHVASTPEEAQLALVDWQREQPARIDAAEAAGKRWGELQGLLAGRSVQALQGESELRESEAASLSAQCAAEDLATAGQLPPLAELETREARAKEALAQARGALGTHRPLDIAGAQDDLAVAEARATAVRRSDETIRKTIDFLRAAQDKVHRDVARALRATMRPWLAEITAGRYADCRVDPESLQVEVCGADGLWRKAGLLSHGTSEQIYLIVRLALAQHLANADEACPLVLDDVVSACDGARTQAILDALLRLGEKTQVILFTHDDAAAKWAQQHLAAPEHGFTEL